VRDTGVAREEKARAEALEASEGAAGREMILKGSAMDTNERIDRLEQAQARLRAEHNMLNLAFCYLLQGELSRSNLARLRERQLANARNTNAPAAVIEGTESAYQQLAFVLNEARRQAAG
jgi:hypothetical protein